VLARSVSLTELVQQGASNIAHLRDRAHPPSSTVEWLGLAVSRLPELSARARTIDEIAWRPGPHTADLHAPLRSALESELAGAAALLSAALGEHLRRHPESGGQTTPELDAEAYAEVIAQAHRTAPRRAEFLTSGYAAFLSAAIEAAGCLGEAEIAAGRARRWDRSDNESLARGRAEQVYEAIVDALGGLLAYARLTAVDAPPPSAG
jgi:hypothetical protein